VRGGPLAEILFQIKKFIEIHPTEFLFITFQEEREHSLNLFASRILQTMIVELFQSITISSDDISKWFKIETVTMKDIREKKKNIFLCFNGRIGFSNGYTPLEPKQSENNKIIRLESLGVHNKNTYYIDKWHNTDEPELLFKKIEDHSKLNKDKKSKFVISQFILTISSQPKKLIKTIFFNHIPTIGNINRDLNKNDQQIIFIDDGMDTNWFNISKELN
jgi:hypothetical protein